METKDLLGRVLVPAEKDLLDLYTRAKAVAARTDLPPCAKANVDEAVVRLWNVVNDLQIVFEEV